LPLRSHFWTASCLNMLSNLRLNLICIRFISLEISLFTSFAYAADAGLIPQLFTATSGFPGLELERSWSLDTSVFNVHNLRLRAPTHIRDGALRSPVGKKI